MILERDTHTVAVNNVKSISIPKAQLSGLADDDFVIILYYRNDLGNVPSMIAGTFTLWDMHTTTAGRDIRSAIWYKLITDVSSEPTNWIIQYSGGANGDLRAIAIAYSGVDTTDPIDALVTATDGTNDYTPDAPDITTVADNALIVTSMVACDSGTGSTPTEGAPSGFTFGQTFYAEDNRSSLGSIAHKVRVSAGTETIGSWTHTGYNTSAEWHARTMSLAPASSVTTITETANLTSLIEKQDILSRAQLTGLVQKQGITVSAAFTAMLEQQGIVATANLSAVLEKLLTANANLTGLVETQGLEVAAQLTGLLEQQGLTATANLDALLALTGTSRANLTALVQDTITTAAKLDALLEQQGLDVAVNLTGILVLEGAKQIAAKLTALVERLGIETAAQLTALVEKQDIETAAQLTALIQATRTANVSLTALAQKQRTINLNLSAAIQLQDRTTASKLDTQVQRRLTVAALLSAIVSVGGGQASVLLDSLVQVTGQTVGALLTAVIANAVGGAEASKICQAFAREFQRLADSRGLVCLSDGRVVEATTVSRIFTGASGRGFVS